MMKQVRDRDLNKVFWSVTGKMENWTKSYLSDLLVLRKTSLKTKMAYIKQKKYTILPKLKHKAIALLRYQVYTDISHVKIILISNNWRCLHYDGDAGHHLREYSDFAHSLKN